MTEFGREYGEGLYALCAEEKITDAVLAQLAELKGLFRENPDFIRLLSNMSIPKTERVLAADQALQGQVHPYVLNFIKLLVERGAIHEFAECAAAYQACYNREHGVVEAEVTTAQALNEEQRRKLIEKLQGMTGKEVVIKEKVDPSILGGVLLQMDGKRYDNTVAHRLQAIKQAMAGE